MTLFVKNDLLSVMKDKDALEYVLVKCPPGAAMQSFQQFIADVAKEVKLIGKAEWERQYLAEFRAGDKITFSIFFIEPGKGSIDGKEMISFIGEFRRGIDGAEMGEFSVTKPIGSHRIPQKTVPPLFINLMFYYLYSAGIQPLWEAIIDTYSDKAVNEVHELAVQLNYLVPVVDPTPARQYLPTPALEQYINRVLNTSFYEN